MGRILLIDSNEIKPPIPPIGLEYIAEALINQGYGVDLTGYLLEKNFEEKLEERLEENIYVAVGINIRNIDYTVIQRQDSFLPKVRELVSRVRELTQNPIIVGGAGFSIQPKEILHYVNADFGVEGCGIPALEILLKKIERGEITRGAIIKHESEDYLNLSFRRNVVDLKFYQDRGGTIGVSTKSGCNQRCIYCTYPAISGHKIRLRNLDRILEELENLIAQGIKRIFFTDSVFNIPEEHAKAICTGMIKRRMPFCWEAYLNPRRSCFSEDFVNLMAASNLNMAYLGIDSGSDKILSIIRKGFNIEDIERATKLCRERGLKVGFSILFGAPGESQETIDETFSLVDRLEPDYVDVQTAIRIYNQTEMAVVAEKEGIIKKPRDLLKPIFYPFNLIDYIYKEVEKRKNCHLCPIEN